MKKKPVEKRTTIEITVQLPTCWKKLIDVTFPSDLAGVLGEKADHWGIADPRPHYDDCRDIEGTFGETRYTYRIYLASGQSNYYGGLDLFKNGLKIDEGEPMESFGVMEADADGVHFKLIPRWIS